MHPSTGAARALAVRVDGLLALGAILLATWNIAGGASPPFTWTGILVAYGLANLAWLRASARGMLLAVLAIALAGALLYPAPIEPAVERAGFFFALLVALQFLARIASRSPDIAAGAAIIVSRPPGLRYLSLTFGTHLFGIFLNIGAVVLMISMLMSARQKMAPEALRSLTTAVVRGFGTTALWSPLSISVLISLSLVEGVSYAEIVPFGITIAIATMLVGYFLDATGPSPAAVPPPAFTRAEAGTMLRVALRMVSLVALALSLAEIFDFRLIDAVFLGALIVGAVWYPAQIASGASRRFSLWQDVCHSSASVATEVTIVAGASFVGSVLATMLLSWRGIDGNLDPAAVVLCAAAVPFLTAAAGMLAVNPIITTSIVLGVLDPAWPAEAKFWLALAVIWGWTVTTSGTPFTANIMMTANMIGRGSLEVGTKWNATLTAIGLLASSAVCAAGTFLALG